MNMSKLVVTPDFRMKYRVLDNPSKSSHKSYIQKAFQGDFAKELNENNGNYVEARKSSLRKEIMFRLKSEKNNVEKNDKPVLLKEESLKMGGFAFFQGLPSHVKLKTNTHNHLVSIQLERCNLSCLPDFVLELNSLKYLNLSRNRFSKVSKTIRKLSTLEHLDLSENIIEELPATLHHLRKLKYLNLSDNALAHLGIQPILELFEERKIHEKQCLDITERLKTSKWESSLDPITGKDIYYDQCTRSATNTKPIQSDVSSKCILKRYQIPQRLDRYITKDSVADYKERKRYLELNNISEWSITIDQENGNTKFHNNVSGRSDSNLPHELDFLGNLSSLECLKVNHNKLSELPPSLTRIFTLRNLEARNNNLFELPSDIGKLQQLSIVKVDGNRLQNLPESMGQCRKIKEMNLSSNLLHEIPAFIPKMKKLQSLNLGNNGIKRLLYSLGFLENLLDLMLYNNPLEDPPYDVILEGVAKTLWVCRQKYWANVHGETPKMKILKIGVGDECLTIEPKFQDKLREKILEAKTKNFSLELQQLNLKEIPQEIHEIQGLRQIDLSRNCFDHYLVEFPKSLCSLLSLCLQSCKLREITPSIQHLKSLLKLNLENNHIQRFPKQINRLRRLQRLYLGNNKLHNFPDISELTDLREINLNTNKMQNLPNGISSLQNLEILSMSRNLLQKIDSAIIGVKKTLKKLNLMVNMIKRLPIGFGNLRLSELKLSGNRLEHLEDDCFLPNLINAEVWIDNNNLLELPRCIENITNIAGLKIEMNPMRSPPMELLGEGIGPVIQYCRARSKRRDELQKLLKKYNFSANIGRFGSRIKGILIGDTGFLTPNDLRDFDQWVDLHTNDKFFSTPTTIIDVVERVSSLREERQRTNHRRILEAILDILWGDSTSQKVSFDKAMLRDDVLRPWGRNKEKITCFAFPIKYLFQKENPNCSLEPGIPSIHRMALEKLTDITHLFDLDEDAFLQALSFKGPYGVVSRTEKIIYEKCDCADSNHNSIGCGTCKLESIVISRIIYTDEEVRRRSKEEIKMKKYFKLLDECVTSFCKTKIGLKSIEAEIKLRMNKASNEIKELKIDLKKIRLKYSTLQEAAVIANKRKKDFDGGKPYIFHRLQTSNEALNIVNDAEENLGIMKEQYDYLLKEIKNKELQRKNRKRKEVERDVIFDLKDQFRFDIFNKINNYGRVFAHRNKLRRPWDGQDGYEYNCFKENISVYEFQSMSEESMNRILDNLCNSHEFHWQQHFKNIHDNPSYSGYQIIYGEQN